MRPGKSRDSPQGSTGWTTTRLHVARLQAIAVAVYRPSAISVIAGCEELGVKIQEKIFERIFSGQPKKTDFALQSFLPQPAFSSTDLLICGIINYDSLI
jgi:hypothetical protein